MKNFNTLLTLSELKEHYGSPPVGICPLYNGKLDKTIVESKTGNPIVLPPYKSITLLNISFSPKQAGTGDPSPENIRPISGWDSVNVTNSNESESHDYNITLPETIYGGTVDVVTGKGGEEWSAPISLTGEETWGEPSAVTPGYKNYRITSFLPYATEGIVSSHFLGQANTSYNAPPYGNRATTYPDSGQLIVQISESVAPDLDSWKSYLAAQASAGTPVQVAYKLATPEPFKVNPISIPSLNGINTLYSDADNLNCDFEISSFWSDAD